MNDKKKLTTFNILILLSAVNYFRLYTADIARRSRE